MAKRILSIVLVLVFTAFFAACGSKDTANTNDSSSAAGSDVSSASSVSEAASSEATGSEASSGVLKGYKDGVYYGNGYSLKIPEGFSLSSEAEMMVIFINASSETLSITTASNPTGEKVLTKEDFESLFSAVYPDSTLQDFKSTKVDGNDAYTCLLIMDLSGIKVYTYCAVIPTDDSIISITMGFRNEDTAKVFENTFNTIKLS